MRRICAPPPFGYATGSSITKRDLILVTKGNGVVGVGRKSYKRDMG